MGKSLEELFKIEHTVNDFLEEFKKATFDPSVLLDKDKEFVEDVLMKSAEGKQLVTLFTWLRPCYRIEKDKFYELTKDYFEAKEDPFLADTILERHQIRERPPKDAFKYNTQNPLLTELLATREGQCISFSSLFMVLAKRLGAEVHLCEVKNYYGKLPVHLAPRGHACATIILNSRQILFDLTHGRVNPPHKVNILTDEEAAGLAYVEKSVVLDIDGDFEKALNYVNTSIELYPSYSTARHNKGVILERMGQLSEARVCFKKATEIDPQRYPRIYIY